MNKLLRKQNLAVVFGILVVTFIVILAINLISKRNQVSGFETSKVLTLHSKILAKGEVESQNQVSLNFQMSGKLVYLPFKEGDTVYQGQTIAQLDTYTISKQLEQAINNYKVSKDSFDQLSQNQQAGILEGQQRTSLDTTNKNAYSAIPESTVIYDAVNRIIDENKLTLNNSAVNVDIAKYAFNLATLVSPIDGVLIHEDVTSTNINITPVTSFVIADPLNLVFKANVFEQDILSINLGDKVLITLQSDNQNPIEGEVTKIYPQRKTLATGENVYIVDIKADKLVSSELGQGGNVTILAKNPQDSVLVPSWTVVFQNYIWVLKDGKPVLEKITVGKTDNGWTEVLNGLKGDEKIITDPKSLLKSSYVSI
jgi:RND family efflux transporter MFP subunit